MPRRHVPGTVYLLHFDWRYRHAAHYLGWSENLPARLADHQSGHGARLLTVIHTAGIGWQLARTWDGTRALERQLKRRGGRARLCPICKAQTSAPSPNPTKRRLP
jgi:predicted GIY-YIG superfamily endonuclease